LTVQVLYLLNPESLLRATTRDCPYKYFRRSGSQTLFGNPFMDAPRPARRRASWKAFPNRIWERENERKT